MPHSLFKAHLSKDLYGEFCREYPQLTTIFQQPWWLDLDCGPKGWDAVVVLEKGKPIALLPFCFTSKFIFQGIGMPKIAPYLGIIFQKNKKKNTSYQLSLEHQLIEKVVSALPKAAFFDQFFHPRFKNALSFHSQDFQLQMRYSYGWKKLPSTHELFSNMESRARGAIRKAKETTTIVKEKDGFILFDLMKKTFGKQRIKSPYSEQQLCDLLESSLERNCGNLYVARNQKGKAIAAAFLVLDGTAAYDLLQGSDPDYRQSGAMSLTVWHALQDVIKKGACSFDFTGSMMKRVEPFLRSFGANQIPYLHLSKEFSAPFFWLNQVHRFKKNYF